MTPPAFASDRDYDARLADLGFWWPHVAGILDRHGLGRPGRQPEAGIGGSYPTVLCGDLAVKLFGHVPSWRGSHAAERAAHRRLARDPEIAAPRLVAEGRLCQDAGAPWPYLVTTRMAGTSWHDAELPPGRRLAVAAELGGQIRRVHALDPSGIVTPEDWPGPDPAAAAARSSLPPHLVAQVDGFLARLGPSDVVFAHCDLFSRHVFVEDGRLCGIIDWGDAMAVDRHCELAKLHLDTFACDKALLRAFLDASDWPVGRDFPRRALAFALHRQAIGLAQHRTNDTFHKLPSVLPLAEIATLDELADALFAV